MSLKQYKTIVPKDYELDVVQRNTKEFLTPLQNNQLLDGRIIKDVALVSSGSNTINHGLGRNIVGFVIANINANANVWKNATQPLPALTLILETSANATVDLYVY